MNRMAWMPLRLLLSVTLVAPIALGCGSTKSRLATEQLLVSDAVDRAVAAIDFRSLAGENVYFDTRYLVNVKGVGFVNSEYIISSMRQQMVAADVRLKEKLEEADYVVEARVGTLGSDGNEIIYGIPANKGLSEASSVLPNAPPLPTIPEISVARKESQVGAVKVAAFAYERKTGGPIWQSGIARAKTTSQDVWLFGAGPFQRGSIHSGTSFAGGELQLPGGNKPAELGYGPPVAIDQEYYFPRLAEQSPAAAPGADGEAAKVASQPEPAAAKAEPPAAKPAPTPAPAPSPAPALTPGPTPAAAPAPAPAAARTPTSSSPNGAATATAQSAAPPTATAPGTTAPVGTSPASVLSGNAPPPGQAPAGSTQGTAPSGTIPLPSSGAQPFPPIFEPPIRTSFWPTLPMQDAAGPGAQPTPFYR